MNMTTEERLDAIDKRIDHIMKCLDSLGEHITENTRLINAIDSERADELLDKLKKENPGMFKVELTQAELDAIVNLYPQGDETECMSGNEVPDAILGEAVLDFVLKQDEMRSMTPDESTPINTIVYSWSDNIEGDHNVGRFFKGIEKITGRFLVTDKPDGPLRQAADYAKIDIEADLQFRAFLNAPKDYRWFTVDEDSTGWVWKTKPYYTTMWQCDDETGDSVECVGVFSQYQKYHKDILIKRKD